MCAGNLPEFPACLYRPQNYNFIYASTGMDTSTENEPLCGEFSQLFDKDLRTGYPVRNYSAFAELKFRIIAFAETVKQKFVANADFFFDD